MATTKTKKHRPKRWFSEHFHRLPILLDWSGHMPPYLADARKSKWSSSGCWIKMSF